ncbi:MAG: response regulator [Anaerolineae bacterium]|nr:response regulator [Anaerolineae bacterium]
MATLLQEYTVLENSWALVVEDDAHDLLAVTRLLQELRVQYKRNTTGKDVALKARTMQPRPDIILLDMDLPDASTFDICEAIHSDDMLAAIPVVAIGDRKWTAYEHSLQACGFAGFICKPLPRRHFGQLLQDVLDGKAVWSGGCES